MSAVKRKNSTLTNGTDAKKPKANGNIASFFNAPRPKIVDASAPAPAVKFDKQKWVDGLTPEQKELLKLEIETLDDSWLALLRDEVTSKEFLELKKFLDKETSAGKIWFPPKEDVYSWSRHTPFNNVKVVIVGQDPYHNVNQAHGMAFSVRPPTPAPPSLKNIYIALGKDYPSFVAPPNKGGLLIPWADRGVLMLNTCLTVRAHEANSHSNRGWERFTQKVIDLVAQKRTRGVVFIAWGTPAGKRVQKVDKQRHLILQSVHPSPLSAPRGFFDCGHFKTANEWLVSRYGDDGEIDWALTPGMSTKKPAEPVAESMVAAQAATNGADKSKKVEGDMDSDDEDALEEALRLAEEEAKS
ncbi:Uracil-DNA glycosylase [Tolypocladium capitatum]|uniref:Uracil-DNA glycosylase n=1 Tax=Tolypocladium capitatum TaxID=45235 RepID=A0A2K3QBX2_9HYPO|nr:Uracil-DNA glycosylase [Tolypocladium capitatum]